MAKGEEEFSLDGNEDQESDPLGVNRLDLYGHVFPPRERHNTLAFVGCLVPEGETVVEQRRQVSLLTSVNEKKE